MGNSGETNDNVGKVDGESRKSEGHYEVRVYRMDRKPFVLSDADLPLPDKYYVKETQDVHVLDGGGQTATIMVNDVTGRTILIPLSNVRLVNIVPMSESQFTMRPTEFVAKLLQDQPRWESHGETHVEPYEDYVGMMVKKQIDDALFRLLYNPKDSQATQDTQGADKDTGGDIDDEVIESRTDGYLYRLIRPSHISKPDPPVSTPPRERTFEDNYLGDYYSDGHWMDDGE